MPEDPTIYIANTSYSDADHAPPDRSNLFILVNSPYVDSQNWESLKNGYSTFLIDTLEKRGLVTFSDSVIKPTTTGMRFLNEVLQEFL